MEAEVAEEARREASEARIIVMRTVEVAAVVMEETVEEVVEATDRVAEATEEVEVDQGMVEEAEAGVDLLEQEVVEEETTEDHLMTGGEDVSPVMAAAVFMFAWKLFLCSKIFVSLSVLRTVTSAASDDLCPQPQHSDVPDLDIDSD